MKKTILAILALLALAGGAEWMVLAFAPVEPAKLSAALVSLALALALFVALTDDGFVRVIRAWALRSCATAVALPLRTAEAVASLAMIAGATKVRIDWAVAPGTMA